MILTSRRSMNGRISGLLMAACFAMLAGCGVTEPDPTPWQNVGSFSWPTKDGAKTLYKSRDVGIDPIDRNHEGKIYLDDNSEFVYDGKPLYAITWDAPPSGSDKTVDRFRFLPLSDRVVTYNDIIYKKMSAAVGVGLTANDAGAAQLALTAPLDKNHSWTAHTLEIRDDADNLMGTVEWRATIAERYSYWKLNGHIYKNVVAVRYESIVPKGLAVTSQRWIRLFAEGVGEILTVRTESRSSDPSVDVLEPSFEISLVGPPPGA
jgi:hypothetical protein